MPRISRILRKSLISIFAFSILMILSRLVRYISIDTYFSSNCFEVSHNYNWSCNTIGDFQTWIKWRQSVLFKSIDSDLFQHCINLSEWQLSGRRNYRYNGLGSIIRYNSTWCSSFDSINDGNRSSSCSVPPILESAFEKISSSPSQKDLEMILSSVPIHSRNRVCGNKTLSSMNLAQSDRPVSDLTLVSAFFNLDYVLNISKFSFATYRDWFRAFGLIRNPMVFFSDAPDFLMDFLHMRDSRYSSRAFFVNRSELTTFRLYSALSRRILEQNAKRYNNLPQNVRSSDYTLLMHAKYELVKLVIDARLFPSRYIAWVDAGYFRFLHWPDRPIASPVPGIPAVSVAISKFLLRPIPFLLSAPESLDDARVGYTQVFYERWDDVTPEKIVHEGLDWLAGGFFIGTRDTLTSWIAQYRFYVEWLMRKGLVTPDQQVLYAMYTKAGRAAFPLRHVLQRRAPGPQRQSGFIERSLMSALLSPFGARDSTFIELQPFLSEKRLGINEWMYLGYLCRFTSRN